MSDVKYVKIPSTDHRLGRNIEHDPRSRAFAFVAAPSVELKSVKHARRVPVLDQGNLGSCTGNAGIGACGTDPLYATLVGVVTDFSEDAAVKLYSDATQIDEWDGAYPPDDTGSSGLAIAKVLKARGWIFEYQHTFTFEDMLAALQNGPVLFGTYWYNNFFSPDEKGFIKKAEGDTIAGGHEIVADEVNMEESYVGFTNSWGEGWGDNGRFYVSFDLLKELLAEEGDVVVPIPNAVVTPPTPEEDVLDKALWDDVKSWAAARHTGCNRKAAKAVTNWAKAKGLTT